MSRDVPSRNRFAEVVLGALKVPCSHIGCKITLKFSDIKEHEAKECQHRPAICKWEPLGCDWKGVQHEQKGHHKACGLRMAKAKTILANVQARDAKKETEKQQLEEKFKIQTQICQMLSHRCRDMVVRDVVLEKDALTGEMCSKAFTAMGLAMEIITDWGEKTVNLQFRVVNNIKSKLSLEVVVLAGPGLLFPLAGSLHKVILRKKQRKSTAITLPVTPEQRTMMEAMDTIPLRMVMSDVTGGRVARSFTSLNDTTRPSSDDSDSESDDADHISDEDGEDDEDGGDFGYESDETDGYEDYMP
jgi:hypothetical protein